MLLKSLILLAAIPSAGEVELFCFSSQWCEPCRLMQPAVDRLLAAGYPIRKIDIDRDQDMANRLGVHQVPCFVLVHGGQPMERVVGATSFERLAGMLHTAGARPQAVVRGQSPGKLEGLAIATLGAIAPPRRAALDAEHALPADDERHGPASRPPSSAGSARQQALRATVRLRVDDDTGHSYGTGTVIDGHGDESLVVTCAHIFRSSQGRGAINVHLFVAPQAPSVRGKLISHDYERDVALVSIRTPIGLEPVQVAAPSYHPSVGEAVFSIGCDQGKEPSIREGRVNAINRYLGPANLVVSGRPTDGRSGGGLFNSDGQLLGVCYAADPQADEGLYAALPRIYTELDQNGLAFIYRRDDNVRATATPDGVSPEQVPGVIASATPLESSSAPTQSVPPPTVADWDQTEVVCIVRSKSDRASPSRVIVLDQPSTQFMEQLSRESGLARTASTTAVR